MILTNFKVFLNCLCWSLFAFGLRILWCFAPLRPLNKPSKCICVIKCIIFLLSSFFCQFVPCIIFLPWSWCLGTIGLCWSLLAFGLCVLWCFSTMRSLNPIILLFLSLCYLLVLSSLFMISMCVCVCVCVFVCVKRDFEHPIPRKKSEKIGNCSVPVWCLLYDFDFLNFWFFFMLYYLLKACQILNQLCVTCEVPFRVWACVDQPFG